MRKDVANLTKQHVASVTVNTKISSRHRCINSLYHACRCMQPTTASHIASRQSLACVISLYQLHHTSVYLQQHVVGPASMSFHVGSAL
jgi:hypothetical protein